MKRRAFVIGTTVLAASVMFLVGFLILPTERPDIPLENAAEIYTSAHIAVTAASDITLNISKATEMRIDTNVFQENSLQELVCTGLGSENMRSSATETLSIGNFTVTMSEAFSNSTGYVSINGANFSSPISAEDYLKRFAPAMLMDTTQYKSITGIDNRECYVISFSQPIGAELWALDDNFTFVDASGTAYVSYDGQLTKSIYTLTYSNGKTLWKTTYTVDVVMAADPITLPDNAASFQAIDYLDGPRMLERASGYLMLAKNVSSHYTDSIYFEAFGDSRTQDITQYTANGENQTALVKTSTVLKNDSRVGQNSQLSKAELFTDSSYLVSTDGGEFIANSDVTADHMVQYCQNRLVSTVMLPQHITGAQIVPSEESLRIEYSASDAFATSVSANACHSLYQQPELLNDLAQSRTTDTLQCYLEFDRITGLPITSGISYSGTHNIEGTPYTLRYKADQIYDLLSRMTTEEIKKAAG